MKTKIFFISLLVLGSWLGHRIGFYRGCGKVIGSWEKADLTESLMRSHCYGDRDMHQDALSP